MTNKITSASQQILAHYRAALSLFYPKPAPETFTDEDINFSKSFTQVATLVSPQAVSPKSGELKFASTTGAAVDNEPAAHRERRRNPLTVRMSDEERKIITNKAKSAGCSVNRYVKAAVLSSDYKPPTDPELTQALLRLNRELTAQGNNLNQIARHLNNGKSAAAEGTSLLAIISRSMLQTHKAIRDALSWGKTPEPP